MYAIRSYYVYKEGSVPTGLLCLGAGKVKIFKEGVVGRDQIVQMSSAPDIIGYRAFFAEEIHIASAVVIEPCTIFYISKEIIYKLLESNSYNFV